MSNYWVLAVLVVLALLYFKKDDIIRPPSDTVIRLQGQRVPLANTEAVASNDVEGYSTVRRLARKMPRGRPIKNMTLLQNSVARQVEEFSRTPSRRNSYSRAETVSQLRHASR